MSVRPLCLEPDPVLRTPARRVEAFTSGLRRLARDLIDTMYAHQGIGLAAPQIGCELQVFVVSPSQARGRELVVANPVLEIANGKASIIEGCLSLPETWERVRRASQVRLRGQDILGNALALEADGLLAIILQHEVDHLQGRLFIDRLSWIRRQCIKRTFNARRLLRGRAIRRPQP